MAEAVGPAAAAAPSRAAAAEATSPAEKAKAAPREEAAEKAAPLRYELREKVGAGSFGEVYKARERSPPHRVVAVKILDLDEAENELESIKREVSALSRCRSDHVVAYYGSGVEPGTSRLWVAMEYCAGGSVSDHLAAQGAFDEVTIAGVMRGVFSGLAYLHAGGFLHRDVKGANVLLTDAGGVRLSDFGVSGQLNEALGSSRHTFVGTPYWMAPEVIACGGSFGNRGTAGNQNGRATDDGPGSDAAARQLLSPSPFAVEPSGGYNDRADVWSAGITACEMALGHPPRSDVHPMRALFLIAHDPPPSLPDGHGHSRALRDLVAKCLRRPPTKRPAAESLLNHRFLKAYDAARADAAVAELVRRRDNAAADSGRGRAAAAAAAAVAAADLGDEEEVEASSPRVPSAGASPPGDSDWRAVPAGRTMVSPRADDTPPGLHASTYALLRSVEEARSTMPDDASPAASAWSQLVQILRRLNTLDGARLDAVVERAMRRRTAHLPSHVVGGGPDADAAAAAEATAATLSSSLGAFLLEEWKEGVVGTSDDI